MISNDYYKFVFEPYRGSRASYHHPEGNVGDRLIDAGTFQLFDHYSITLTTNEEEADVFFWAGGGNMGTLYPRNNQIRRNISARAKQWNKPFVILPQSWNTFDSDDFDIQFVRDPFSLKYAKNGVMCHDLACAYRPTFEIPDPRIDVLYAFRKDKETKRTDSARLFDPAIDMNLTTAEGYILLAASAKTVVTDRIHFALSALIAGRKAILVANSYHKNRGIWEFTFRDLGCEFVENYKGPPPYFPCVFS